jgi:RecA/RadA recombinase
MDSKKVDSKTKPKGGPELKFVSLLSAKTSILQNTKIINVEDPKFLYQKNSQKSNGYVEIFENHSLKFDLERRLPIDCPNIDNLLLGGFPLERVVEIFGAAGTGKTQLA